MTRDLLNALRFFGKNPLFTLAVTAILGLGIGANTAAFSIVDAVLLRPLPYKSSERLVRIEEVNPKLVVKTIAPEDYRFWAKRGDIFDKTAPYLKDVVTITNLSGNLGDPEQVFAERTSAQVFSLLGVPARLGRSLIDSDDVPGAPNVVVLSDRLWRRLFHADPGVIGRSITASDEAYTIVGVMPVEFEFPASNIDMWIPLRLTAGFTGWLEVVARMQARDFRSLRRRARWKSSPANWSSKIAKRKPDCELWCPRGGKLSTGNINCRWYSSWPR